MFYPDFHERVTAILSSGSPFAVADAEAEARRCINEDIWETEDLGLALGELGEFLTMQARYTDAARTIREAMPMVTDPVFRHQVVVGWAYAINADNEHDDAPEVCRILRETLSAPAMQVVPARACGLAWLSRLAVAESPKEALALAREAVSISIEVGLWRTETKLALGFVLRHHRLYDEAIVVLEEVVSAAKGRCLTEAQTLLAELYDDVGEDDQTDRVLANAVEGVPVEFAQQYHRVLTLIYKVLKKRPERGTQMLGRLLLRMDHSMRKARKGGVYA